jgi:hypothetical protein
VVGETNDSYLNDIRARIFAALLIEQAIAEARGVILKKDRSAWEWDDGVWLERWNRK